MNLLLRALMLLAAGAAGWGLAKRTATKKEKQDETHVYYIEDDMLVNEENEGSETKTMAAAVLSCYRRMDPITLTGSSEVTFILADGEEKTYTIPGEGGMHLMKGDAGMLTCSGDSFLLFEKENGETIGGMFYAPVREAEADE